MPTPKRIFLGISGELSRAAGNFLPQNFCRCPTYRNRKVGKHGRPYREVPVEELFMRNDTARLNLIICRGNYDSEHQTYDYRLVVYSVLAPEG